MSKRFAKYGCRSRRSQHRHAQESHVLSGEKNQTFQLFSPPPAPQVEIERTRVNGDLSQLITVLRFLRSNAVSDATTTHLPTCGHDLSARRKKAAAWVDFPSHAIKKKKTRSIAVNHWRHQSSASPGPFTLNFFGPGERVSVGVLVPVDNSAVCTDERAVRTEPITQPPIARQTDRILTILARRLAQESVVMARNLERSHRK